jgi:hypothetical protein
MRSTRLLWVLTLLNLGCLAYQMSPAREARASADPPVLRGRGPEIVDAEGRLRAQLTIAPADPTHRMPDGATGYPEAVIFRLITRTASRG